MFTLTEKRIEEAKSFIDSIPESIGKGNYQRWFALIREDGRITDDHLANFVALAHSLPVGFQDFPQEFSSKVRNPDVLEDTEVKKTVKKGKK